jgi:hypothetical protein
VPPVHTVIKNANAHALTSEAQHTLSKVDLSMQRQRSKLSAALIGYSIFGYHRAQLAMMLLPGRWKAAVAVLQAQMTLLQT